MTGWQILRGVFLILVLFLVINFVHFRFLPVRVVLYDAVIDIFLSIIGFAVWARWGKSRWPWSYIGIVSAFGASLALNGAIMGPTVIDRSLSIYILEKLNQRGGEIRFGAWDALLKEEFFDEYKIVDIRMTEQINSGTVEVVDGCVKLTPKGRWLAEISSFYRRNFLPKRRDIMGEYTDALTDPLKSSVQKVETRCAK